MPPGRLGGKEDGLEVKPGEDIYTDPGETARYTDDWNPLNVNIRLAYCPKECYTDAIKTTGGITDEIH